MTSNFIQFDENAQIKRKGDIDISIKFDEKAETRRFYVDFLQVAGSDLRDLEKSTGNLADWLRGTCDNRPYKERNTIRKILAAESDLRQIFVKIFEIKGAINSLKEQIDKNGLE
jgi:hypothetical protein